MTDEPTHDPVLKLPDPYGRGTLHGKVLSPSGSTSRWVLRTTWTLVRPDGTEDTLDAGTAHVLLILAFERHAEQ
jgi:hypothetical protein